MDGRKNTPEFTYVESAFSVKKYIELTFHFFDLMFFVDIAHAHFIMLLIKLRHLDLE